MGYHGNILLSAENQWEGGRRDRDKKPNYVGREGERTRQKT